jgi:CheY-like chemotaxis protein
VLQESLPEHAVWIDADPLRISQIVCNLLNNSLKFTDSGGTVRVNLIVDPPGIARISIKDSGIGIDSEMMARLFDPFYQAESSLERSRGGLGLGLALVKRIAELHGGSVQAFSEGSGYGSEIAILLHMDNNQAAPEKSTESEAVPQPHKILVIEDNLDAAESINLLLTLQGYAVRMVHTGDAALAEAEVFLPDVILCDIGLPGTLSGYDIAKAVRKSEALSSTYLIALTGYGQEYDLVRSKQAGFDVHLGKPLNPNDLVQLLSEHSRKG